MSKKKEYTAKDRETYEMDEKAPLDFAKADEFLQRFRSRYDGLQDEVSAAHAADVGGEQITKQAFKDEVDINNILKKYQATGILPNNSRAALAQFGDFSGVPSYRDSLDQVMKAQEMFSELPAAVRNRFRNDPGELITFLADKNNRDDAVRMGLIDPSTGRPPLPTEAQAPTSPQGNGNPATSSSGSSGGK